MVFVAQCQHFDGTVLHQHLCSRVNSCTGLCWCLMEGVSIKQSSSRDWSHAQWFCWLRLPVNPQSADGCFHPSANSGARLLWCGGHRGSDRFHSPTQSWGWGWIHFSAHFGGTSVVSSLGSAPKTFYCLFCAKQQNVLTEKIVGTLTNPDNSVVSDLTHTLQVVWLLHKKLCFWTWSWTLNNPPWSAGNYFCCVSVPDVESHCISAGIKLLFIRFNAA